MIKRVLFVVFVTVAIMAIMPLHAEKTSCHMNHGEGHGGSCEMHKAKENAVPVPEKVVDLQYEICPVMGGKTVEEVSTMVDGKIYHFCCPGCISAFKKDVDGFSAKIKNIEEKELKIQNRDKACVKTGKPARGDVFKVVEDKITFYCCPECIETQNEKGS